MRKCGIHVAIMMRMTFTIRFVCFIGREDTKYINQRCLYDIYFHPIIYIIVSNVNLSLLQSACMDIFTSWDILQPNTMGPFYSHGFTLILAWICRYMSIKMRDQATYWLPYLNGCYTPSMLHHANIVFTMTHRISNGAKHFTEQWYPETQGEFCRCKSIMFVNASCLKSL